MIVPVGHRVLLKISLETKTKSGLILAVDERVAKAGMEYGEIVAVGENAWKAFDDGTPWAAVGDQVYFSKYGGKIVNDPTYPNTESVYYMIISDGDILGKVVDNNE